MNRKNRLTGIFAAFIFIFCGTQSFTQEYSQSEHEELDLEQLEKEADGISEDQVNKDLQSNFVIIEPTRTHELNPQTSSYSSDSHILTALYEGLFSYNPVTLQPQYAIASGYRISRDKKRMTFTIRSDAKFSNGQKITAKDVRDSWLQLLATPDAPYASLLDIIRGAQEFRNGNCRVEDVGIYAADEQTLSVYLNSPANYLPKVLCHVAFSVINSNPTVYSGPFVLDDQTENKLILKKNPNYWDKAHTYLEKITILQSSDADENAYMFNNGDADWVISEITPDKILNKSTMQINAEFGTSYYFFKTSAAKGYDEYGVKKLSYWDYPEFRNAVMEAIPWDILRSGALVPAATFVYPLTGYPEIEGFNYTDKLEAIQKMNYARKKYSVPEDQIIPLVFEIPEFGLSEEKEKAFKEALEPLGVKLTVKRVDSRFYLNNVKKSDSDMFSYSWIGDFADPLSFLELFHSGSTLNDSGWGSYKFDQLLEMAAAVDDAERYKLLAEAEKILLDDGMVIPLAHPVSFNVINLTEVGGWVSNPIDIHLLKFIYKRIPAVKKSDNVVNFSR